MRADMLLMRQRSGSAIACHIDNIDASVRQLRAAIIMLIFYCDIATADEEKRRR